MTDTQTLAIEAEGLVKTFGETRAVDGLDLSVRRGAVYGVLGPNGAGKTTTIRILATLLQPDAGSARVLGRDVVTEADEVRGLVSLTGQLASVDEDLTGRGEPDPDRPAAGLPASAGEEPGVGAVGGVRPGRRRRQAGEELLRRHAAAHRHRRQLRGHAAADVPRRADDGARPARSQPGLGDHPLAGGPGHDGAADDAVPGRGGPARRAGSPSSTTAR